MTSYLVHVHMGFLFIAYCQPESEALGRRGGYRAIQFTRIQCTFSLAKDDNEKNMYSMYKGKKSVNVHYDTTV